MRYRHRQTARAILRVADRRRLEESEARLRTLVNNAPVGVFMTDVSGAMTFVSEPLLARYGQPGLNLLGDGWRSLLSPIDGTVVTREVSLGQAVQSASDAFKVANLSHLWVLLDLFEKDLPYVHVDQHAVLRTEVYPGKNFPARVAYVGQGLCFAAEHEARNPLWRFDLRSRGATRIFPGGWVQGFDVANGVVAVAADHRREAFALCAGLVDEVKARLPVWKHQTFADGTDEWVGCA